MVGVAAIAGGSRRNHLACFVVVFESEEGPSSRKSRFIFYVYFQIYYFALEVALLIDRTFPMGFANFEHKRGLVGPGASLYKFLVGFWIYEDIVKHMVVVRLRIRAVAHIEPRR